MIGGSDTELKVFEMQRAKRKELNEKRRKESKKGMYRQILFSPLILAYNYPLITVGVLAVGGYFAYKKFKK